jgi:hypothetical protein
MPRDAQTNGAGGFPRPSQHPQMLPADYDAEFIKTEGLSAANAAAFIEIVKLPEVPYQERRKSAAKDCGLGVVALDKLRERYRDGARSEEDGPKERPQANVLLDIARDAELFHTDDDIAYADISVEGHRETWPVKSKAFRDWLARGFFALKSSAPSRNAADAAMSIIEARARFDSPQRTVYLRTARIDGKVYLDLCDDKWRAVEIDCNGWRITAAPPVRFRRARGMLPLPIPLPDGDIDMLRPFLNVAKKNDESDSSFVLTVAWLIGALSGLGPYAILALSGEQGAAKTFFGAVLRELIDPNKVPQRALPRHDHDLYVAGGNALVLAFDNISTLPDWLSDTLCRLSTGGGFAARQLYSDAEEQLFDGMRPLILNGIEDFVTRPDLGDRSIFLVLEDIPAEKRRPEAALWAEFEAARPKILGALLDAISHGLAELNTTTLSELPRMADFALWVAACEGAVWKAGTFEAAYKKNRESGQADLIETDAVAVAVQKLAKAPPTSLNEDKKADERIVWQGTASAMLDALNSDIHNFTDRETRRDRNWPRTPRKLAGRLRRMAPSLRRAGIILEFDKKSEGAKLIAIELTGAARSEAKTAVTQDIPGLVDQEDRA